MFCQTEMATASLKQVNRYCGLQSFEGKHPFHLASSLLKILTVLQCYARHGYFCIGLLVHAVKFGIEDEAKALVSGFDKKIPMLRDFSRTTACWQTVKWQSTQLTPLLAILNLVS